MKRIPLIGAGLAVLTAAGGAALLQHQAGTAADSALAHLQEQGLALSMASPPQWQWWPPGLHSSGLVLKTTDGDLLLSAPSAFLALGPDDLFSHQKGELRLPEAHINYRQAADGSSNWDALFHDKSPSLLRGLVMENARLEWRQAVEKPLEISLGQLHYQGSGKHSLTADFLISRQNVPDENLLLENHLDTQISTGKNGGWQLHDTRLDTTISSTRLPGTFIFSSRGDITVLPGGLHSENLAVEARYKMPGMADNTASLRTSFKTDWQAGTLTLHNTSLDTGQNHWQLDGDLIASLAEKSLRAEHLTLARSGVDQQAPRMLALNQLLFLPDAAGTGFILSGNIGAGRFRLPLQAAFTPASANLKMDFSASDIDVADLRSWLDDKDASGHLTLQANLQTQGQSWQELQQAAEGSLSLDLQNGFTGSVSVLPLLHERLQGYAALLPELAPIPDHEKGTPLRRVEMQLALKAGVFTTGKFSADIDLARLNASGHYDSRAGLIDYHGTLALDRRLFTGKSGLELPLACQGNIREEQVDFRGGLETDCKVDEKAKQDLLARALINRFRS